MKMKKVLTTVLSLSLVAALSIAGTIAYLQDTDSDANVMTLGNVQIEQIEQQRSSDGLVNFVNGQAIYPAVVKSHEKEAITVGDYENILIRKQINNYVDKIVSVKNTGAYDAYVRTIIAFPEAGEFDTTYNAAEQWLHWNAVSDTDTTTNNGWIWGRDKVTEWPGNTDKWDVVENVEIEGKKYDIYVVTNKNIIEPGEQTAPSLLGFYIDSRVEYSGGNYYFTTSDGKEYNLGDISQIEILVATQAVQANGFDDAWTALDEAFGDITDTNHPWSNVTIANELGITEAGTYDLKGDIYTIDTGYFHTQDVTDEVTINGNGATVQGIATSADSFQWEGGTIPAMSAIFSSKDGSKVTVNDLTFEGTISAVMAGNYINATYTNFDTVFNNVNIVDAEVVSFSAGISPALCVYGTAVLNNCNIYGTTLSELDTSPMWPVYDMAVVNYSNTTVKNCTIGSIYMWNQAKLTIADGTEVEKIVIRGNMNTSKYGLVVEAGATVNTIDLSNITDKTRVNITIEEGATVNNFVANGVTYTSIAEWQAAE